MRPQILYPLFKPVTTLKGVGPRIAKAVETAAGPDIVDLLWHLPQGVVDRRYQPSITDAEAGRIATIEITVGKHEPSRNKRMPYRVRCFDESGEMSLVFFHAHTDYLQKTLPEGAVRVVSGQVEHYQGAVQITHPDHIVKPEELESILRLEPTYGLSAGVSQKVMVKAVSGALEHAPEMPEWLDPEHLKRESWPDWKAALISAHHPGDVADLEPTTDARKRLAYDELLSNQLALALVRRGMRRAKGRPLNWQGILRKQVTDALDFDLTGSQVQALSEIDTDLKSDVRMLRLLQGDVGSGKTVVALLAMLAAIESGSQAV
ncbi:MAG: ATP-dependent DNA helicase RecG, partial [Rhodospirillaceae bacterium]|nr:ATP-dependent DNA helicase RecG [Rhodospirillaceae bacterium]